MKNTYRIQVQAQCPVTLSETDVYAFTIESESVIRAEVIREFFSLHAGDREVFQEHLTQLAAVTLGARVTSVGQHRDVEITCTC